MTAGEKMGDGKGVAMELCKEEHREEGKGGPIVVANHADELDEPFLCFICLELVHKPVVNACGHLFCFWCVHQAMSTDTESYCPLCRNPYMHFPRVCEQLHFLLLKAMPDAYRRRCKEVSEEEPMSSPQFSDGLNFNESGEVDQDAPALMALEGAAMAANEEALPQIVESVEVRNADGQDDNMVDIKLFQTSSSSSMLMTQSDSTEVVRDSMDVADVETSSSCPYVTISDLLCTGCKKLMYRPVVVNCGHAFCEGCVKSEEINGKLIVKCSSCGCLHPGGFPQVCLELHQYLEQNFNAEYKKRKDELTAGSPEPIKPRNNLNKELQEPDILKELKSSKLPPKMHPGIGCDGCGMFPMFGRRFRCIDCPKIPGYDLCWHCFQSGTNLTGRFNQQHKPQHRIREVIGNPSLFDPDNKETGEGSEGMDTYFGIVGYFA
ncbi:unnamed protein product [Calypogeia fissa]